MKLSYLLSPWAAIPFGDCDILGLSNDSRTMKQAYLFIAYLGALTDGRAYILKAIEQGAVAVVYEPCDFPLSSQLPTTIPCIPIPQLASQLGAIANRFFETPGRALSVSGVTGTNGKTTIAYQLTQAHHLLNHPAAYIGTLGEGKVSALKPLANTTPDPLCLMRLFYEYQQQGIQKVCMEVSSHALSEHRVDQVQFMEAIFTNLSHEHLDYHQTMQSYADAKALLFAKETLKWVIINHDDEYGRQIDRFRPKSCQRITYGMHASCDVYAFNRKLGMGGSDFDVKSPFGETHLTIKGLGAFNIYNSLAIFTSLMAHGYALDQVTFVMSQLKSSPGRMEVVSQEPLVIVDYAHTPDALENVLITLVAMRNAQKKACQIWVVFGCGGDRDKTKRPIMGRIASQYADITVLTSDNPRNEDPNLIIEDIAIGLLPNTKTIKIEDRFEAIKQVLQLVSKEDIVLIAGKGHETYQQIGHERLLFSDQQVVLDLLLV